jgi:hypothetical protein
MKSDIRKKLKIFTNLEFPIIQKSGIFSEDLTVFGKTLTVYGKDDIPINSSNIENCAENMVGRKGCVTISVLKVGFKFKNEYQALKFSFN